MAIFIVTGSTYVCQGPIHHYRLCTGYAASVVVVIVVVQLNKTKCRLKKEKVSTVPRKKV